MTVDLTKAKAGGMNLPEELKRFRSSPNYTQREIDLLFALEASIALNKELVGALEAARRYLIAMASHEENPDATADQMIAEDLHLIIKKACALGITRTASDALSRAAALGITSDGE